MLLPLPVKNIVMNFEPASLVRKARQLDYSVKTPMAAGRSGGNCADNRKLSPNSSVTLKIFLSVRHQKRKGQTYM